MRLTGCRCECRGCGELFNSVKSFDRHRRGTYTPPARRCLSPDEMRAKGMTRNAAGYWITEARLERAASFRPARRSDDLPPGLGSVRVASDGPIRAQAEAANGD
jgi:hypothetical protein